MLRNKDLILDAFYNVQSLISTCTFDLCHAKEIIILIYVHYLNVCIICMSSTWHVSFTSDILVATRNATNITTDCQTVEHCSIKECFFNRIVFTWNMLPLSKRDITYFPVFKRALNCHILRTVVEWCTWLW